MIEEEAGFLLLLCSFEDAPSCIRVALSKKSQRRSSRESCSLPEAQELSWEGGQAREKATTVLYYSAQTPSPLPQLFLLSRF